MTEKQQNTQMKMPDIKKETTLFLRIVEIARMRGYDLHSLLSKEITTTSFFMLKDGFLRKPQKSEFARELKECCKEDIVSTIPNNDRLPSVTIIDFMAFCRKVPIKKSRLRTYEDFFNALWSTFDSISRKSNRIDIVFDLYLENSIKEQERSRRGCENANETIITSFKQSLPVDLDSFWASADNKVQLQQKFIDWMKTNYKGAKPIYLGGANKEDLTSCIKIAGSNITLEERLKCTHEEADDRMLYHVSHAVRIGCFRKVIVATADTDVFVNLIHHFPRWQFSDLEELWVLQGNKTDQKATPVHTLVSKYESDVIDVLPAVHALTGNSFVMWTTIYRYIVVFF